MTEVYPIKAGAICTHTETFLGLCLSVCAVIPKHRPPRVNDGELADLKSIQ